MAQSVVLCDEFEVPRVLTLWTALLTLTAAAAEPSADAGAALPEEVAVTAVGDIAECTSETSFETAKLAAELPGPILALGDLAYEQGTVKEFTRCYHRSWGRFKPRTYPAPGNHEYYTRGASGYFDYFGKRAGLRHQGWYSFTVGSWLIVALNSNDGLCSAVACDEESEQVQWLRRELAQSRAKCTLAFWHHPRFSSGAHGGNPKLDAIWRALYQHGVDVALTGHDHSYERFAPLNDEGVKDPERGLRQFVVGTGGRRLRPFVRPQPDTSEVRSDRSHGVLRLKLRAEDYEWEFLPTGPREQGFTDRGTGRCH